ncbi:hypothetical protein WA026_008625 [Henosepilachna vigintioctopunctata]|uniref:Uncharacterized protein n=1 Tax=Henosepilachna vigintioctopunctata TaxID=420089 RepID=A0AAW1UL29_9CUCU
MGFKVASKTFSVPQTTLKRKAEEEDDCNYILDVGGRPHGLTTKDLRALEYTLAVKNEKDHMLHWDKGQAGEDWLQGILSRHSELTDIPLMVVKPRKKMDPELMLNAAPEAWGVCSVSGWMTDELFLGWFKKFIEFSGAKPDRPVA